MPLTLDPIPNSPGPLGHSAYPWPFELCFRLCSQRDLSQNALEVIEGNALLLPVMQCISYMCAEWDGDAF